MPAKRAAKEEPAQEKKLRVQPSTFYEFPKEPLEEVSDLDFPLGKTGIAAVYIGEVTSNVNVLVTGGHLFHALVGVPIVAQISASCQVALQRGSYYFVIILKGPTGLSLVGAKPISPYPLHVAPRPLNYFQNDNIDANGLVSLLGVVTRANQPRTVIAKKTSLSYRLREVQVRFRPFGESNFVQHWITLWGKDVDKIVDGEPLKQGIALFAVKKEKYQGEVRFQTSERGLVLYPFNNKQVEDMLQGIQIEAVDDFDIPQEYQ